MFHFSDGRALRRAALLLLILYTLPLTCTAQGIAIDPSTITFNSTPGDTVTRSVIISATENVTGLSFYAQDLLERSGTKTIPQAAIYAAVPSEFMKGSLQQVPISFNLANVPSGLYSGEIWLASSSTNITKIPVTATVKVGMLIPFVVLLLGVILTYGLYHYSSRVKRLDELWKALGIIEEMGRQGLELSKPITFDRADRLNHQRSNPYYDWIRDRIATLTVSSAPEISPGPKRLTRNWRRTGTHGAAHGLGWFQSLTSSQRRSSNSIPSSNRY